MHLSSRFHSWLCAVWDTCSGHLLLQEPILCGRKSPLDSWEVIPWLDISDRYQLLTHGSDSVPHLRYTMISTNKESGFRLHIQPSYRQGFCCLDFMVKTFRSELSTTSSLSVRMYLGSKKSYAEEPCLTLIYQVFLQNQEGSEFLFWRKPISLNPGPALCTQNQVELGNLTFPLHIIS